MLSNLVSHDTRAFFREHAHAPHIRDEDQWNHTPHWLPSTPHTTISEVSKSKAIRSPKSLKTELSNGGLLIAE